MSVDLICHDNGKQQLGGFVIIDKRVLVVPVMNSSLNLVLEKPLKEYQIHTIQSRLKLLKLYEGNVNGIMDEATMISLGFYAETRGALYRFKRTVITENLLDNLTTEISTNK